ncbi:TetR family transcriptional regulator [Rhodococcus sp. ACS1]|uniref:acyl-CoA-like ligand-binding transcription factor n=1 Tax=Rhodococcus sp. ACS1 TaxID=2028570 RepID=UPI000BB124DB|nr:TetR family transcriptional regulator [Rhodococcus sp. ACS1]PBC47931.1 TetR family transcriptional regulator [Rhodococcus sp. ACS1]
MTNRGSARGRPRRSSRLEIEQRAIGLFLRDGYSSTSIEAIAVACGISKTTYFRYYGSKSELVWWVFDEYIRATEDALNSADLELPVMAAIRQAVMEATGGVADDEGTWMKRFELLDTTPELRDGEAAHWQAWGEAISRYVAARTGSRATDVVPAAVGGALQAAYLAGFRESSATGESSTQTLARLDATFALISQPLQAWINFEQAHSALMGRHPLVGSTAGPWEIESSDGISPRPRSHNQQGS